MLNKKYAVGLAGYVDCRRKDLRRRHGKLLEILSEIRTILNYVQVENIFPFGTASLRNSTNGREIVSLIQEKCGFNVQILTGEEEAVFDYYGATNADINSSGLLVDVGGGSTELAFSKIKILLQRPPSRSAL